MNNKDLAKERIRELFVQAKENHDMANRYVTLIRKMAMKFRLSLSSEQRRKFCKHCYNYFRLGNYRVRNRNGKMVYYCLKCKKFSRIPYRKVYKPKK